MKAKNHIQNFIYLLFLQGIIVIYTCASIAAKFASSHPFLSPKFFACYAVEIFILAIYAVLWQQAIKRFSLSVAYANRGTAIFWALVWSSVIFKESISVQNVIGVMVIFAGVWIVNQDDMANRNDGENRDE